MGSSTERACALRNLKRHGVSLPSPQPPRPNNATVPPYPFRTHEHVGKSTVPASALPRLLAIPGRFGVRLLQLTGMTHVDGDERFEWGPSSMSLCSRRCTERRHGDSGAVIPIWWYTSWRLSYPNLDNTVLRENGAVSYASHSCCYRDGPP